MDQPTEITRHQRRQMEREQRNQQRSAKERQGRTGKVIGVLVLFAIIGIITWAIADKGNETGTENPNALRTEDHVEGATEPTATLIEYSDFQCPACATYYPLVKQLVADFPKDLRVVYRHYPLTNIHLNAMASSQASEAASIQGKFWEMHDILFGRQNDWSNLANPESKFLEYAKELKLNEEQFTGDMNSSAVKDRIKADQRLANQLRVNSTPTFFLNNSKIGTNPQSIDDFRKLILGAITVAQSEKPKEPAYHAHADIRMIINNKAFDFTQSKYQSTKEKELDAAVHLHNNNGTVLHLHTKDATLGTFYKSLGMELDNNCITLDTRLKYCSNGTQTLRLFVNGKEQINAQSYVPQELDRILIAYGAESEEQLNALMRTVTDESCIYSRKCPERGTPPKEECVGGLETDCQ